MNRISTYKIALAILLLVNIGLVTKLLYQNTPPRPGRDGDQMLERIIEQFDFDDNQTDAFRSSVKKHSKSSREARQRLQTASLDYYLSTSNEKTKDSLLQLARAMHDEIYRINSQHFDEVRDICKAEQLPEVENLIRRLISKTASRKASGPPPDKRR